MIIISEVMTVKEFKEHIKSNTVDKTIKHYHSDNINLKLPTYKHKKGQN